MAPALDAVRSGSGERLMVVLRAEVSRIRISEEEQYQKELSQAQKANTLQTVIVTLTIILNLVFSFWAFHRIHSDVSEHRRIASKMAYLASFPTLNPNPIIEVDLEGRVLSINPAAANLFPDLEQKGPSHPYLADWNSAASALLEKETETLLREVKVETKYYQQAIHYVLDARRVRIYGIDITNERAGKTGAGNNHRVSPAS